MEKLWMMVMTTIFLLSPTVYAASSRGAEMLNPQFDTIAKAFIQRHYALFDNKETRPQLINFYHPTDSILTFENEQFVGAANIIGKLESLPLGNTSHSVVSMDTQPMFDGGIFILVTGLRKICDDSAQSFIHALALKPISEVNFVVQHDIFRLTA